MNDPLRHADARITASGPTDPGATDPDRRASVFATLALSLGGPSRVLLRDTDADGDAPSEPPSRPGSAEMPTAGAGPGGLQFLGEIARGGMGAVLKGRDPDLSRDLAVKVLLDRHRDDPDLLRRFVEEAQIAGQLQHPGIVPVYRLGMLADRRPYFTMKLVKGRTLTALLDDREPRPRGLVGGARAGADDDRRPLFDDLPRFVAIFEQVCRTVAYAHSRGVIHRDLKPSNVMVGGFGEVQVMDWGLAKVLARGEPAPPPDDDPAAPSETIVATARSGSGSGPDGSGLSRAGSVIGTPAYMAPEQARGEVHRVDMRADVFALGAILCEVLTGRPPYAGRGAAEVRRMAARGDTAEALAAIDGCGGDVELIAIARDCLAAEPDDRPPDARAVADRVAGHLAGVGERLRRAELDGAAESARAAAAEAAAAVERRARRLTIGLAAAVLVLIGTAGGGYAWLERDRAARRATTERAVAAELDRAHALRAEALAAPADRPGPWYEAMAAARGAEGRLRQGDADPALEARVATAIAEVDRDRAAAEAQAARIAADRTLLAELETVRGGRADHGDPRRADADYAAAFRKAGLDLDAVAPEQAGGWIAARTAPLELAAFLDDWATVRQLAGAGEAARRRPADAARAADKDPWRDALRAGRGDRGPAALAALHKLAADGTALDAQPVEGLRLLALRLRSAGDREAAARVLARAWRKRPDDFWVHYDLAQARGADSGVLAALYPRPEEAVRHLTAALAVRPRSAVAHTNLGAALHFQGKVDEAVAALREAIRLQPGLAMAHNNLGNALQSQGELDEAVTEHREAIRLAPDFAMAHNNLGNALKGQGKVDEAVAEYREAIRIKPDYAPAHYNLGNALARQDKVAVAVAEYREAIRLKPDYAEAHCNLGLLLRGRGDHAGALAMLRRGHELGSRQPGWRHPSAQWVADAERLATLAPRLPALLRGEDRPRDGAERLAIAQMCCDTKRFATAARLWAEALAADPKLGDDRQAGHRYNAACAAALAGCGQGADDPRPDDAARARLRGQALGWLEAERAAWAKVLDSGDAQARPLVRATLEHWRADDDLAGVRDPAAIRSLPAGEQAACRALWAEVDALRARAQGGPS